MEPSNEGPFEIGYLGVVGEQMRRLGARAKKHGILPEYLVVLRTIISKLKSDPLAWGDPLYHTHKEGGVVLRGLTRLLSVHYAVYESYRAVVILDLDHMPHAWPE